MNWIKLEKAGTKDELFVDFILPASYLAAHVYPVGWAMARVLTTALNIATFGFFWWELPRHIARFYEKLTDLESGKEVRINRNPVLKID